MSRSLGLRPRRGEDRHARFEKGRNDGFADTLGAALSYPHLVGSSETHIDRFRSILVGLSGHSLGNLHCEVCCNYPIHSQLG